MTKEFCLDQHSDEAHTITVTSDTDKNSHVPCNQPVPQSTHPPPTRLDHAVVKSVTSEPAPSVERVSTF